jgi:hypothetical protein
LVRLAVDRAIKLNDQRRLCTIEVGDVAALRMLAAELRAAEAEVPKRLPKNPLGGGLPFSQLAAEVVDVARDRTPLSTALDLEAKRPDRLAAQRREVDRQARDHEEDPVDP